MKREIQREILELAKRQEGVVGHRQLAQLGVTYGQLRRRLQTGEWTRVVPSVVRMAWADEDSWLLRLTAAQLWGGDAGALSFETAAVLHGFMAQPADKRVHLTVPSDVGPQRRVAWLKCHRGRGLGNDVERYSRFRVTTPERTLLDLAHSVDSGQLESLARWAVRCGSVDGARLRQRLARVRRAPGIATLRLLARTL